MRNVLHHLPHRSSPLCLLLLTHMPTLCLILSLSSVCLCCRDNSLYRGNKLRQARLATYTEVGIYVSHRPWIELSMTVVAFSEYTEESALDIIQTLFCKAVKVALNASRMFLGLLSFPVFSHLHTVGYWLSVKLCLQGAINGRKCPWCGYKRTSAVQWDEMTVIYDIGIRNRELWRAEPKDEMQRGVAQAQHYCPWVHLSTGCDRKA